MANRYLTHLGTAVILHVLVLAGTWHISQSKLVVPPTNFGPLSVHSVKLKTAASMILPHNHAHTPVLKKSALAKTSVKQEMIATSEVSQSASTTQSSIAQGGSLVGDGTGVANAKDLFKAELSAKIDQHKSYPLVSRRLGQSGQVVIAFTLEQDGSITNARIDQRTLYDLLNEAALKAVREVGKFKAIPKELGVTSMELKIPVNFRSL